MMENVSQHQLAHNASVERVLQEFYVKKVRPTNHSIVLLFYILVQRSKSMKYCSLDCQAGGTCVYVQSKAQCRCPKGRTGRLCQTRMFPYLIHILCNSLLFSGSGKSLSDDEDELDLF